MSSSANSESTKPAQPASNASPTSNGHQTTPSNGAPNGTTRRRMPSTSSSLAKNAINTLRRGFTILAGQKESSGATSGAQGIPSPPVTSKNDSEKDKRPTIRVAQSPQPLSEPVIQRVDGSPVRTSGHNTPLNPNSQVNLGVDELSRGRVNGRRTPSVMSDPLPNNGGLQRAPTAPPSGEPFIFTRARSSTSPIPDHIASEPKRVHKRLVVCCDGTWFDGIAEQRRWRYSNVLKLSRCIDHEDARNHPPIPQILFYQSGLGSQSQLLGHIVDGAFGAHLVEKVQEVYAWIAHNYMDGDEIFLFGFSRGAYTVRMVSQFIGELGLLSRSEMDNFAEIFRAYQRRCRSSTKPEEKARYDKILEPYMKIDAYGRKKFDHYKFPIKVIGVFDTVGSFGVPSEFTINPTMQSLFSFPDTILGSHIERAYHAMALNEERADFNVTKFVQSDKGRAKSQVLKQASQTLRMGNFTILNFLHDQMWFAGSHSDVGGGFQDHDLSDLALVWMVAEVEDTLAINLKYFKSLLSPVKPWGKQGPHDSKYGVFALGSKLQREIEHLNQNTCESIHLSVLEQLPENGVMPHILELLQTHPHIVERRLLPLEREMRSLWKYVPGETPSRQDSVQAKAEKKREDRLVGAIQNATKKAAKKSKFAKNKVVGMGKRALGESELGASATSLGEVSNQSVEEEEGVESPTESPQLSQLMRSGSHHQESSVPTIWDELMSGLRSN